LLTRAMVLYANVFQEGRKEGRDGSRELRRLLI
jgi:hypothetical protein